MLTLLLAMATAFAAVIERPMTSLVPDATITVGHDPDWMVVTPRAVWVTTASANQVTEIVATTNHVGLVVTVNKPCSGLAAGFGSIWIPSCGDHSLLRVDQRSGRVIATIAAGPANSEGCVTTGAGSVWIATAKSGILSRIDPRTNRIIATIPIASGSFCALYASGFVWVTSTEHNVVSKIDPAINRMIAEAPVGKSPRFQTAGANSIWTLNQGDGTISRINMRTNRLLATIPTSLKGPGGEICFGFGSVWATLEKTPITRVDPATNQTLTQWTGAGGDSIRAGHGSIWLTNLQSGLLWRLNPAQL